MAGREPDRSVRSFFPRETMSQATAVRRYAAVYGIVVLQTVTVILWVRLILLAGPGLTRYDQGRSLYLLPHALFVLLGCLGFGMIVRMGRKQTLPGSIADTSQGGPSGALRSGPSLPQRARSVYGESGRSTVPGSPSLRRGWFC